MSYAPSAKTSQTLVEKAIKSLEKQRYADAEQSIAEAINQDQANPELWSLLGKIWFSQNRFDESKEALTMALQLNVQNEDALNTMGELILKTGGNPLEGLAWIEKAYSIKSNNMNIALNLANAYTQHKIWQKALFYCNEVFTKTNDKRKAHEYRERTASILHMMGDYATALNIFSELVLTDPANQNLKSSLVNCYQYHYHHDYNDTAEKIILTCLNTDHLAHRLLARPWASLIKAHPQLTHFRKFINAHHSCDTNIISDLNNELLCAGLQRIAITDPELEIILTNIRRDITLNWNFYKPYANDIIPFLASLGMACWYNEFIFFDKDDEQNIINKLKETITTLSTTEQANNTDILAQLCLLSCYKPLFEIATTINTLKPDQKRNKDITKLITAQITNPNTEKNLIPSIKSFGTISDQTSMDVRAMYESRPYPRWRSMSELNLPKQTIAPISGLNLLVAGCGTGQEPMQYAMSAPNLKITAIDLSLPSIAYAKRMANEYHVKNIEFQHGDLMNAGTLNKSFDIITSSGVLHHLKHPEKGLEALTKILKPDGRLSLSLYSKIARDLLLSPAQDFIKAKNYSSNDEDLKRFRQDMIHLPDTDPCKPCMTSTDFYTLSECNDLLFHIQEHRYTLLDIKSLIAPFGLELFYIATDPATHLKYGEQFPDDPMHENWNNWHNLETKNPETFSGMYKIWFRFKNSTKPHPADQLIKTGLL